MPEKQEPEPTQKTQPKGKDDEGKPAKPETIPVPKRGEFFGALKKVSQGRRSDVRDESRH